MRIRVNLEPNKYNLYTVFDVIWCEYDEDVNAVVFLSSDADWVSVKMSDDIWRELSVDLLVNNWLDLIDYVAFMEG